MIHLPRMTVVTRPGLLLLRQTFLELFSLMFYHIKKRYLGCLNLGNGFVEIMPFWIRWLFSRRSSNSLSSGLSPFLNLFSQNFTFLIIIIIQDITYQSNTNYPFTFSLDDQGQRIPKPRG